MYSLLFISSLGFGKRMGLLLCTLDKLLWVLRWNFTYWIPVHSCKNVVFVCVCVCVCERERERQRQRERQRERERERITCCCSVNLFTFQNDLTGEHSCIMLHLLTEEEAEEGQGEDSWLLAFWKGITLTWLFFYNQPVQELLFFFYTDPCLVLYF